MRARTNALGGRLGGLCLCVSRRLLLHRGRHVLYGTAKVGGGGGAGAGLGWVIKNGTSG